MQLHHIAILAREVGVLSRFYRDALQLVPIDAPRPGVAWFRLGDGILMIEPTAATARGAEPDAQQPGLHLLALSIAPSERSSWEQRLAQYGVPIERRTDYTLYVRDPEGNRVGLSHFPLPAAT